MKSKRQETAGTRCRGEERVSLRVTCPKRGVCERHLAYLREVESDEPPLRPMRIGFVGQNECHYYLRPGSKL